jgi:hypothetical protein
MLLPDNWRFRLLEKIARSLGVDKKTYLPMAVPYVVYVHIKEADRISLICIDLTQFRKFQNVAWNALEKFAASVEVTV